MKGGVPRCREAKSTLCSHGKRQTDGQTDRQTGRQAGRQTETEKKSSTCVFVENYCTIQIHDTCSINQAAAAFRRDSTNETRSMVGSRSVSNHFERVTKVFDRFKRCRNVAWKLFGKVWRILFIYRQKSAGFRDQLEFLYEFSEGCRTR